MFFIFGFFVGELMELVGEIKIVLKDCFEFLDIDFKGFVIGVGIWSILYFIVCIVDFIFVENWSEGRLMFD